MNRTLPSAFERTQTSQSVEGVKHLKEQMSRLETKVLSVLKQLGLTFSYEPKIRALEEKLQQMQNTEGASGDFERELQRSSSISLVDSAFKHCLERTQSNLIGSFDRLQENLQLSLQTLNKHLAAMEDSFLEIFQQSERQIIHLTKSHNESTRRIEALEQTLKELSKKDQSAIGALESLIQLKIDKNINETGRRLNSIEGELHRSEAKLREEIKELLEHRQPKDASDIPKNAQSFERMLEGMNQQLSTLISKTAQHQKTIAANRQLLDSTRGQLIKSNQASQLANLQLRADLQKVRESIKRQVEQLNGEIAKKMASSLVGDHTFSAHQCASIGTLEKPDSAGGSRSQLQQFPQRNPLPQPKKFIGGLTTEAKGDIMIADEMTPPHSVSRFDEPNKESYAVGIKGLRKSKEKNQDEAFPVSSSKKELKPLAGIFNPPKPRRDLPPVQHDQKLANKNQPSRRPPPEQHLNFSEEDEDAEFFVNQEGFIINEEGQLILDKWGQPIPFPTDEEEDY